MANHGQMIVPATQEPTFWNRDAAVGFFFLSIVGLLIGGYMGKSRMQQELLTGKVVSEPTFWNKSIFVGAVVAGLIAAPVIGVGLAIAGLTAVPMGAIAALGGAELLGMIYGGYLGKARLSQEYAEAEAYVAQHGNYNSLPSRAPQVARDQAYQISPSEAQQLESRLADKGASFADAASQQASAAQGAVR